MSDMNTCLDISRYSRIETLYLLVYIHNWRISHLLQFNEHPVEWFLKLFVLIYTIIDYHRDVTVTWGQVRVRSGHIEVRSHYMYMIISVF